MPHSGWEMSRGTSSGLSALKNPKFASREEAAALKRRHLIENFFSKLKEFKRYALRADKTDQSFTAMIHIAAASARLAKPRSGCPIGVGTSELRPGIGKPATRRI